MGIELQSEWQSQGIGATSRLTIAAKLLVGIQLQSEYNQIESGARAMGSLATPPQLRFKLPLDSPA